MNKIDIAKKRIEDDLASYPSSLSDPIGDARTYNKILYYLFVSVESQLSKADIADWLYNLYQEQTNGEKEKFTNRVDLLIGALQKFYGFMQDNK